MTTPSRREAQTQIRLLSPTYFSPPTASMLQPVGCGLHTVSKGWALSQKQWSPAP